MKPSLLTLLSLFFIGGYSLKSEAVSVNLGSVQGVSFRSQFDLVQKYSESENQSEYFGLQLALAKSDTESLERDEGKLAPVLGLVGGSVIKITDRLQTRIQVAIGRAGFIKKAVYTSILQTIDFPPISLITSQYFESRLSIGVQWTSVYGFVEADRVEPYFGVSLKF